MRRTKLIQEPVTREAIGAFYEVYNTPGFGFLEHIYVKALESELRARGLQVRREVGVCVMYKGQELAFQRLDLIVDENVVVEVKSTYDLHPAVKRQLYNYCRAKNLEVGIVLPSLVPSQNSTVRCTKIGRNTEQSGAFRESGASVSPPS